MGIARDASNRYLEFNVKGALTKGPVITHPMIWLKTTWGLDGKSRFYYSVDGKSFNAFGEIYQMMWGSYRGDRLAIYNYNNKTDAGYVDIDFYIIIIQNRGSGIIRKYNSFYVTNY
ncbi:hypothetical protein MKP07_17985 [Niabella hibiscisoli]|nr:hypothetical protein [Niabella hibiscisoli]MCH5717951.1 hypothetical protein [Niabella hibiscisoli]